MLLPNIDTRLEEFELPAKLATRLKICKARTFGDIMKIDAADWTSVTPKVVNALKRFQNTYKKHYMKLTGEIVDDTPEETVEPSYMKKDQSSDTPADERRFFVANNILNAYASAGKLYGDRPIQEVMQEIVIAADAFMDAFNGKKPQQQKSRRHQRVETMMNDDKEATEAEIQPPVGEIPIVDGLLVVMDTPAKEEPTINTETPAAAENPAVAQEDRAVDEPEPAPNDMTELETGTIEKPEDLDIPEVEATPEAEDVPEAIATPEDVQVPETVETPQKVEVPESVALRDVVQAPEDVDVSDAVEASDAVDAPQVVAEPEIKAEEAPVAKVAEEVKTEEVKAVEEAVDPAHPKVTPGDIIVLTAYHGRRPSTSRNFQLGSVIKIETTHIDQVGVLQLRGFCGRKPANIDATRWDWAVCGNMEEAQALSSTIIPAPQPKAAAKTENVGDTVSDHSETIAEALPSAAEEPVLPVADEVTAPAAEEPVLPVAEEVDAPAAEEPVLPVADEVTAPAAEGLVLPVADEVTAPAAEEPMLPVAEEVTAPAAEEPVLTVAEEVAAPAAEEPVLPVADEVTATAPEEPVLPVADEVTAPAAEEPVMPVADEVTAPAPEEPVLPVAEEVDAPAAEEPVLPVADEVTASALPIEEPKPVAEEPAPVDTYPQQHRKNDLSGIPQLFDLFLTEEEENAELPF